MKKIMKKALSLMLALVMVFSLAPMTAMAAGTGTQDDPIEVSATETITSDATGQAVYYVYNAPVVASYEITVTGSMGVDSFGTKVQSPRGEMDNYALNNSLSIYVEATDEVIFNLFDCESQELSITIEMIEGTEVSGGATGATPEDAIELTENPAYVTVPGAGMVYYKVFVEEGAAYTLNLYNRAGNDFDLYLYNPRMSGYGWYGSGVNGVLDAMITAEGTEYIFAVGNPGDLELSVQVTLTKEGGNEEEDDDEQGAPLGTTENPDALVIGADMVTTIDGTGTYWYEWTAAVNGKITVTPGECELGWTASVFKGEDLETYVGYYDSDMNETFDIIVLADEVVYIGVNTLTWEAGTVNWTATFVEGDFDEEDDDEEDDDIITEGPTFESVDDNADLSSEALVVAEGEYATSYAEYTVYSFEPTETGVYTITVANGLIGIVSNNGMWITTTASEESVAATSIEWECTGVGQSIWVAVKSVDSTVAIEVEREELVIEEIETENAYPTVSLETYTFDGDLDKLESLMYGLADEKIDFALGEDGFFHVADVKDFDENGDYIGKKPLEELPVVLVKLNDSVVSLQSAIGYGNVKYVEYGEDEDGNPVALSILYFNDMLTEYLSYAATDAKLYPLTEDLLYTMILVGADQGWYVEDGAVQYAFANDGISADLLWAFAMYYLEPEKEPVKVEVPTNNVVTESDLEAAIDKAVADNAPLVVETTTEGVTLTFAPADLKDAEAVKLNVEVKLDTDIKDETVAKNDKITTDNFVLKVEFSHDGKLPAKATITIPVPVAISHAHEMLYYYQIMEDGTLKYICDAPVKDGKAVVAQDHCSDYVLLTEKIVEAPKTGDTTNFALWIAIFGLGVVAMAGSIVMKKREF